MWIPSDLVGCGGDDVAGKWVGTCPTLWLKKQRLRELAKARQLRGPGTGSLHTCISSRSPCVLCCATAGLRPCWS